MGITDMIWAASRMVAIVRKNLRLENRSELQSVTHKNLRLTTLFHTTNQFEFSLSLAINAHLRHDMSTLKNGCHRQEKSAIGES
jgi:hypothetical protein